MILFMSIRLSLLLLESLRNVLSHEIRPRTQSYLISRYNSVAITFLNTFLRELYLLMMRPKTCQSYLSQIVSFKNSQSLVFI